MKFALIGHRRSKYYMEMLKNLIKNDIKPEYVIIEDYDLNNIVESTYFIDYQLINEYGKGKWHYDINDESCMIAYCLRMQIPFFVVDDQTGNMSTNILRYFPIDVLLITEGPIFRGEILYLPKYCVLNMHAASLPKFRGNWTTYLTLYNDEPLYISAHCVTRRVDAGAIIDRLLCPIKRGDTLEEINSRTTEKAIELAIRVLKKIDKNGFGANKQRNWEGNEYRGEYVEGVLQPAMPLVLQDELKQRLIKGEYGFYTE